MVAVVIVFIFVFFMSNQLSGCESHIRPRTNDFGEYIYLKITICYEMRT